MTMKVKTKAKQRKGLESDWEGAEGVVYENFRLQEVPFP